MPQSFSLRSRGSRRGLQLNLTFDWESLNQGVRGESFRWEHWELGKGDFVVDQRLGRDRPIYLRDFTLPDEVEIRSSNAAQPRTFHRILILGNVVLLSLGAGARSFPMTGSPCHVGQAMEPAASARRPQVPGSVVNGGRDGNGVG